MSRSNGHRSPIASLDRIVELAQTLAPLLEDAADAGGRKSRGAIGEIGRHRLRDGHVDGIDPLLRYGPHAARDLLDHQGIAHVGDVVAVSRLDRGTEEVAAFEELVGSHGGIGGWQTEAVLVYPATWHREHDDIRGPDAVYRQLVGWLDELGLRAAPSAEPEPESVSV